MPRTRLSTPRLVGAVAVAGLLVALLGGCVAAPVATPTPTPSAESEPIFASDEEALAAAERAYLRFLQTSADVMGRGGRETSPLEEVASGAAYEEQLASAAQYAQENIHSVGKRTFTTYRLQSFSADPGGLAVVSFYVCDDLRSLDVVDSTGESVVAPDRVVDVPYLIVVKGTADALKVSEKDLWEQANFCA